MATIKAYIRPGKPGKQVNIRLRLSVGRNEIYYGTTKISILPEWWNPEKEELKNRLLLPGSLSRDSINSEIANIKERVLFHFNKERPTVPDWINDFLNPAIAPVKASAFFSYWDKYQTEAKVSEGRRRHLRVLRSMLERYASIRGVVLDIGTFEAVADFENFLRTEYLLVSKYPEIYEGVDVRPRGQNTLNSKLKILRAFFHWCRRQRITKNNPFDIYDFSPDVYGDPLPLLPEEVEHLLHFEPLTAFQRKIRDLFCLQCYTGCRVGDFMALRKDNLQGDILTYIPSKTLEAQPTTVYVPLHDKALKIIEAFGYPGGYLVPRINLTGENGYNKELKVLCREAGITRMVATINTVTRKPEMREMCDLVSSHTARKTFTNSNYKETQDQALISKMTGHSPKSKSFARYRGIDLDMLRAQINKTFGE